MSPMPRPRLLVAAALAVSFLLAGCADNDEAQGDGPSVAAAFYPLAWVAEQVAGDAVEVTNLTSAGGEPHDLELGIAETAELDQADLIVHLGGFQPAVDKGIDNVEGARRLDAAEVLDLHTVEEGHTEDDGHGHEEGELDPHFWLDPLLMADLGDEVSRQLTEIDPDGAGAYEANAAALREQLEALDAAYADGLASCERDTVVVSHDAFGYLEKYGLHLEPIAGLSPDAEPTPADLGRLQQLIRDEGITTVFSERLASAKMAETLADDLGVGTDVLDPLEGLSDETSGEDYLSLMRANLDALRTANGCS